MSIYRFVEFSVKSALLFGLLLAGFVSKAQHFSFPIREVNTILPAAALDASAGAVNELYVENDARYQQVATNFAKFVKYKSNVTLVKFGVDHGNAKLPASYAYKFIYQLEGSTDIRSTTNNYSIVDTLVMAYNPDSMSSFQDLQEKVYPNLYNAKLTILDFYDLNSNPPASVPITTIQQKNLFIELAMQYQPYVMHKSLSEIALTTSKPFYDPSTSLLHLSWNAPTPPYLGKVTPARYELEWTYTDNYDPDGNALPLKATGFSFVNNATRVITDSLHFAIPVVYPKGFIVYRIRMVRPDSLLYHVPVYGPWTIASESGTIQDVGSEPNECFFEITDAHVADRLNWNYTIQYAENGKYKHVQSYYDGLLKNRQTITRFNTNPQKLLVTENVYDYEGRKSITTLPSVVNADSFSYLQGVSTSSVTGQPYAAIDFDKKPALCPDEDVAPPFTDAALANRYYSPLNTDTAGMQKFVPRANGYPFVHTQYSPGFEDRVDRMGGAGNKLQINQGHDVRNSYMSADQSELNSILGINSGYANFYTKTVSKDQNGQLSMSVKDFRGKPVLTTLIGATVDTSTHAIMFNDEVPNNKTFREDKLDGATQLVVGHEKRYAGSLHMDAAGLTNVQYEYNFAPYQVCSAPNYLGLSVAASYDYSLHDDCGVEVLRRTGTIGQTGVVNAPTATTSTVSDNVTLQKGKHTIDKILSVRTDQIYAAVDSFLANPAACILHRNDFIKEEVENTPFPCPASAVGGPCEDLENKMLEELMPGGKYAKLPGTYSASWPANRDALGEYSIFDYRVGYDSMAHRYNAPCLLNRINLVQFTHMGVTYKNLGSMPMDTFLSIYKNAGPYRYDIARALLPLHPEYCRLQACFNDTFLTRLNAIPDAKTAKRYGMFYLEDMIAKDAQLRGKVNSFIPSIGDSLRYLPQAGRRLDTLAAEQAFCAVDRSPAYADARDFFRTRIKNLDFPDENTQNVFFEKLRALYTARREKYKSMAQTGVNPNCSDCDSVRMPIIGTPHVPTIYNPNGSFDTSKGSLLWLLWKDGGAGADSTAAILKALQNLSDSTVYDPATIAYYQDSANALLHFYDSLLNRIAIDSIVSKLTNCYSNTGQMLRLQDTLRAMASRGDVKNGEFLPEHLRYAIPAAGLSLTGLCNPYVYGFNYLNADKRSGNCKSSSHYIPITDFFNQPSFLSSLQTTGSSPASYNMTLNTSNAFAAEIASKIGTTASMYTIYWKSSEKKYRIVFQDQTGVVSDSFVVSLQANTANPISATAPFFTGSFNPWFTKVYCYLDDPQASAEGYMGRYMFRADVQASYVLSAGVAVVKARMAGWNNVVQMADDGSNELSTSIPCTTFRELFVEFADSMTAYNAFRGDHPLFIRLLTNFSNYRLKRNYSEGQYRRFLNSCALGDFMQIPAYGGYARMSFPTGGYNTLRDFASAVMASDSIFVRALVEDSTLGGGTAQTVVLDYDILDLKQIRRLNNLVTAAGGVVESPVTGNLGTLWVPQFAFNNANVTTILAATGFNYSHAGTVSLRRGGSSRVQYADKYIITAPFGMTLAQLSSGVGRIESNFRFFNVQGSWVPTIYPTYNDDYFKSEKQDYLSYTYSMLGLPTAEVLDSVQAHYIMSNVGAFGGTNVSYRSEKNPNRFTDLFYASPGDTYNGYNTLQDILNYTKAQLGGNKLFMPRSTNTIAASTMPGGHSLMLYRSADDLYWYRYFGDDKQLYNVYIRIPSWVYQNLHPSYNVIQYRPGTGDSASRSFTLLLSSPLSGDTVEAYGSTDFDLGWSRKLSDVLLGNENVRNREEVESGMPGAKPNCEQELLYNAIVAADAKHRIYYDSLRTLYRSEFYAHVMGQTGEKLWIEYIDKRFGYTLYSYDLAGNLIMTVPPEGVRALNSTNAATVPLLRKNKMVATSGLPQHTKTTTYEYNTVNKPVREVTPDAGQKTMTYDAKGNVMLSQTQKQKATGDFTYMLYDGQNRLTETGQVKWADCPMFADQPLFVKIGGVWTKTAPPDSCACENLTDSVWTYCVPNTTKSYDNSLFAKKVRQLPRKMVVVTIYDSALFNLGAIQGQSLQTNLRSRIGANMYFESVPASPTGMMPTTNYTHATHYSYDAAGNVKTLVQEFPDLTSVQQRFKRVDYEYDLLSGKVNMLAYNRGYADQFYQRYTYDADNRITQVETSHDGFIWKRDAAYTYYQHGPLARVSLGDHRLQGMDYAYTIQGWLKAINSDRTDSTADMGRDGRKSVVTPKDVYATTIDYFSGDYQPIGNTAVTTLPASLKSLYNGNIARQTTDVTPFGAITANYTYDQMNRIRNAGYAKDSAGVLQFNNWYASAYRYDLDGNIKTLTRRDGAGALMDTLVYKYPNANQDNKLTNVMDYAGYSSPVTLDLPHYTNAAATRFIYDGDGNISADLSSNTTNIKWDIRGRMTDLVTNAGRSEHYVYDALGNRVATKQIHNGIQYRIENGLYYVRDADGNILAEYNASASYDTPYKLVVIRDVRTAISLAYPTGVWINALNNHGYLYNGSFASYILGLTGNPVLYPAGYYLANDPMLRTQYITNVSDLPITLARYSSTTRSFPVARTLMKAMTFPPYTPGLEAMDILERMTNTLLNHPDPNVRMHAVEQMARNVPDLYLEILNNYGIVLNGANDSIQAMNILYSQATGGGGANLYRAKLFNLFNMNPELLMPWLQEATADSLYLDAPGGWSTATGYETMLRDALSTFGDDAAQEEAMSVGMARESVGMYGAISWWPLSLEQVSYWSGGGLADIAYYSDPVNYITSLTTVRGASFLDTALAWIPDYELDLPTLAADVYVPLTTVQLANLAGNPYLKDQSIYLSNHHMYGSSRLGISQYLSGQYKYRYNYEYGLVDTFGMTVPRPWYSHELNSHVRAGAVYPYGHPMDSVALAEHVLGQKQYELVNHLSNVQEVITDKKYWKDTNGDGDRDEAKAVVQSVYDYYPFGQLMAGRSILDTIGMCVTRTSYQEIPNYKWVPGAGMSIGGNVSSEGSTSLSSTGSGGVNATGTSGGIRYEINNITAHSIQLKTFFSYLSGTATITIWQGTTVGTGGTQLGSTTSSFTSSVPTISTSVGGSTTSPKTITVVVSMGTGSNRSLFSVDSIGYQTLTWTLATGMYTTCGEPKDHYEFGYNGQMKSNQIAGMGNHSTARFWEYDSRLGRRWNLDPVSKPSLSNYSTFADNPIWYFDLLGDDTGRVFVPQKLWPNVYQTHIKGLLKNPRLLFYAAMNGGHIYLHYDANRSNARRRRREAMSANNAQNSDPTKQVDEFPYASTTEGGSRAATNVVPQKENSQHGGYLGSVVKKYKMKTGDVFDIVLIPNVKGPEKVPQEAPETSDEPSPAPPNPIFFPELPKIPVKIPQMPRQNPRTPQPIPIPVIAPRVLPTIPIIIGNPNIIEMIFFPQNVAPEGC